MRRLHLPFAAIFVENIFIPTAVEGAKNARCTYDRPEASHMADFVTVAAFDAAPEAHVIKSLLEQAGISVFLSNEHLVGLQWHAGTMGGVEVQVPAERATDALDVLRAAFPVPADNAREDEQDTGICPHCGGNDLECTRSGPLAALSLALGIPLPFARRRMRCKSCGAVWR